MRILSLLVMFSLAGCGDDDPGASGICDPAELSAALASAAPGDTVQIGACRVEGGFSVPAGVTLAGAGAESAITANRGMGIALADGAGLRALTVAGTVTSTNADTVPPGPSPDEYPTVGIGAVGPGSVTLEDVHVTGFARLAVLFDGMSATWRGGSVNENLGSALMIVGATGGAATVELTDLEVCDTFQGLQPISYGVVIAGDAMVTTTNLRVCEGGGFGILQDAGTSVHGDLVIEGNGEAGVWVQGTSALSMDGAATRVVGNGLAGIAVMGSPAVSVADARVEGTRTLSRIGAGGTDSIEVGDGMHLVLADDAMLEVRDTSFSANTRVGIVLQVSGDAPPAGVSFTGVSVASEDGVLGAILQNGTGAISGSGWDAEITRSGGATTLDDTFASRLDVLGAVAPMFIPRPTGE